MILTPALGDQWSHCITNRVMLQYGKSTDSEPVRIATLEKCPALPTRSVKYVVSNRGIRDVPQPKAHPTTEENLTKRTRAF
jgi:hypothetical protein